VIPGNILNRPTLGHVDVDTINFSIDPDLKIASQSTTKIESSHVA
jgi:hypothetical protein